MFYEGKKQQLVIIYPSENERETAQNNLWMLRSSLISAIRAVGQSMQDDPVTFEKKYGYVVPELSRLLEALNVMDGIKPFTSQTAKDYQLENEK